MKMMQNLEIFE